MSSYYISVESKKSWELLFALFLIVHLKVTYFHPLWHSTLQVQYLWSIFIQRCVGVKNMCVVFTLRSIFSVNLGYNLNTYLYIHTAFQISKCLYMCVMQFSCLPTVVRRSVFLSFPEKCIRMRFFSSSLFWRLNPKQERNSDLQNVKYGQIVVMFLLISVAALWIPNRYEIVLMLCV